jgi:bifunctional DNA-binding transcriptional regulator/antitoxin component of YhaV-PrlF toxin-antitoxin module
MPVIRKIHRVGDSIVLTIPEEVRQHLSVNRGDYLVWVIDKDDRVIVEKLTPRKYPGFFIPGSGWLKRGR